MIINKRDEFFLKYLANKGAEKTYEAYLSVISETGNSICDKSITYLKLFVHHHGDICEGIIRAKKNNSLSLTPWGDEYLSLLTLISAYHLDRKEITTGLLWAKKAVDLIGYFSPKLKEDVTRNIISNMTAASFICEYPKQFNEFAYDSFFLDWEVKRYYYCRNIRHFNDN